MFGWWVGAGWQKTVKITVNALVEREKSRHSNFDVGFCLAWFFLIKDLAGFDFYLLTALYSGLC